MPFTAIAPSANFISPYDVDVGCTLVVVLCSVMVDVGVEGINCSVEITGKLGEGVIKEQPTTPIVKQAINPIVRQ